MNQTEACIILIDEENSLEIGIMQASVWFIEVFVTLKFL